MKGFKEFQEEKKWIQKAVPDKNKGKLRQQLQVPDDQTIPKSFLRKIQNAEVGDTVQNPTDIGVSSVKVTTLLKNRVNFAKTVRQFN